MPANVLTNIINSAPVQEQKENVINWLIYKAKKIFKAKEIYDTILLQWDFLHGEVEAYANGGKTHLGAIDAVTGEIYKPAEYGRIIKL